MNRSIAHGIRNLGEIQALVPYELLRRIDFHMGEIIDDAAAVAFTEKLLQLRGRDHPEGTKTAAALP